MRRSLIWRRVQHDYPNTAMKEQLLESLAPLAIEQGRAQDAIDALNSYPATGTRPTLLLERAQAYSRCISSTAPPRITRRSSTNIPRAMRRKQRTPR